MKQKKYKIKEIFFSIQGEGFHTGRPAVFCRFSGCNLRCPFCDTDSLGTDGVRGGEYRLEDLVDIIVSLWPKSEKKFIGEPFVVLTGGEPALQLDSDLIHSLHQNGFLCAIETNGTLVLPKGLDWVCVSPKAKTELKVTKGDELKLVYPQRGIDIKKLEKLDFKYFFVQPIDNKQEFVKEAVEFCLKNPKWRLSLQIHKFINIP